MGNLHGPTFLWSELTVTIRQYFFSLRKSWYDWYLFELLGDLCDKYSEDLLLSY